jgi:hypothetical protein
VHGRQQNSKAGADDPTQRKGERVDLTSDVILILIEVRQVQGALHYKCAWLFACFGGV